jgi:hypothetical protein
MILHPSSFILHPSSFRNPAMSRLRTGWLKALTRTLFPAAPARQRRRSCRLYLEALEDRVTPNAYVVDIATDASGSPAGSGLGKAGDLRYCLNQAIQDKQTDTITFTSSLAGHTITLSSFLVTAPSGFTNPYAQTAFIVGAADNIAIDGLSAPGLTLSGDNGNAATRLFVVEGGGALELENLTLSGGKASGSGAGVGLHGGGGGGGAGLGGAVLVDGSTFTANGCTFVNNNTSGGSGGNSETSGSGLGGGGKGGGLSGTVDGFGGGGYGGILSGGGGGGAGFGGGGGGGADNFGTSGTKGGGGGAGGFGGGGGGGGVGGQDFDGAGAAGAGGFGGGNGGSRGEGGNGGGGAGLGGAIFSNAGILTLTNDTFTQNTASGGAGTSGFGFGFPGGPGQGDGGAVFMRNGTLTATFDTFSSNAVTNGDQSAGTGSDIYVLSDRGDGGNNTRLGSGNATATIVNSILGQNATTTVSDFYANANAGGTAPNLGNSKNDLLSLNAILSNSLTGSAITSGSPHFAAIGLTSNGGPTQTIALTSNSTLALGEGATGTGITTDQRGLPRGNSGVDLGAFQVAAPTLPTTLPGAIAGTAYDQTLTATESNGGAGGPFTFAVTAGALPNNLSLSNARVLAGTPTAAGTFSFTVTATDSGGITGSQVYTFTVTPAVTASSANLVANAVQITIDGFGFDPTAGNNVVTFNDGAVGSVSTATATFLTVTFSTEPTSLGNLTVVVTTDNQSSGNAVQVATVVPAIPPPTVTMSTASLGATATSLTIEGTGFNATAADNTVVFNDGAVGTATTATATSLTVTFSTRPTTAGSLTAVVSTEGISSGAAVQMATVTPVVTASSASFPIDATQFTIHGFGFDPTAANNRVAFNDGAVGSVSAATATSLTVTLSTEPTHTGSLKVEVTTDNVASGAAAQVATVVAAPKVTSSSARLAIDAASIKITDTGFSPAAANDSVVFNDGAAGTVTAATATGLTVTFTTQPTLAGSLTAMVTANGGASGAAVQVATLAPVVTSGTADLAATASGLTIHGFGFNPTGVNTVTLNDATGVVTSATPTSLVVAFGSKPFAGNLRVVVTTAIGSGTLVGPRVSSGAPVHVATVTPVVGQVAGNIAASATQITIHGFGFNPGAINAVTFNDGAVGRVVEATLTSLTVTFLTRPAIAGSLTAVVTSGGQSSGTAVHVATVMPAVTLGAAHLAANATQLILHGFGFDPTAANNTVTFNNGVVGTVTAATATTLTVTFSTEPTTAGSLTAVVTTDNLSSGTAVQVATVVPAIPAPTVTTSTGSLRATASSLTIKGSGFSTTAANNRVIFNDGAIGTVTAATASSLTVTFSTRPITAGSLTAVIFTEGVSSGAAVQVATVTPVVTASTANLAANPTQITIHGFGFDPTAANNTVIFNHGAVGTVTEATATVLTVTFSTTPTTAGSLTAVVTTGNQSSGIPVKVATATA